MKRWIVVLAVLVVLVGVKESQAEWSFTGLGPSGSYAADISADGRVVVGDGSGHWFRWEDGNIIEMGSGQAHAVSADGSIIVGTTEVRRDPEYIGFDHWEAFCWKDGKMYLLGTFGGGASFGRGVSADGSVIVGMKDTGTGSQAFRWENGLVDIIADGGATAVSADGSVVVGKNNQGGFRWEDGNIIQLVSGEPWAVSADGSVIVGQYFLWANGETIPLGWHARDVSADGSVIVGYDSPGGFDRAVIYESGRLRSVQEMLVDHGLDLSGWDLVYATAISDDANVVAGWGYNPSGNREAWIATIPEPSTFVLLSMGALTVGWWRRRRAA